MCIVTLAFQNNEKGKKQKKRYVGNAMKCLAKSFAKNFVKLIFFLTLYSCT